MTNDLPLNADSQILVYEFMENGNLHDLLTGVKKGRDVPWYKRLEIAVGVAQGLDYLHTMAVSFEHGEVQIV